MRCLPKQEGGVNGSEISSKCLLEKLTVTPRYERISTRSPCSSEDRASASEAGSPGSSPGKGMK